MTRSTRSTPLPARVAAATAVVVAGAATLVVADAAGEGDSVARVDPRVAGDVLRVRTPLLTAAAHVLTFVGSEVVVGGLGLLLLAILVQRRRPTAALGLALALGGSAVMTVGIKTWVHRARPGLPDVLGPVDHSFSFPSGHTLNSAVLIGVAGCLLVRHLTRPAARVLVVVAGTALAFGIGASRVYLGYHWTTDVIASWLIAIGWLCAVYLIVSASAPAVVRRTERHPASIRRR